VQEHRDREGGSSWVRQTITPTQLTKQKTPRPTDKTPCVTVDVAGDSPGTTCSAHNPMMATNIVDLVRIPANLPVGDYLLSWRWDVSQRRS
jgi:hypothetical protein